jgi:epoxyqueuosine reductase
MDRDINLTRKVEKFCKKIRIDTVGFVDPIFFERFPKFNQPESYLKGTTTAIIVGIYLDDILLDAWCNIPRNSRNFHFADSIIEGNCFKLINFLIEHGYESKLIPYTPGFYLKDCAALAGLGPIGKNNLLITERFGSQVRLRALCTTAPLICGKPIYSSKYCERCNICIEVCPAKAFSEGKYNKEKCLSYNLANRRILSDYTSIWCNVCIESCPIGKKKNDIT